MGGGPAADRPPAPGRQEGELKRGKKKGWRAVGDSGNCGPARTGSPIAHRNRSEGEDGREYHKRVSREGRAG